MQIPRIHSHAALVPGRPLALGESAARHVARVLRLGAGDPIILFDGSGTDYEATIVSVDRQRVVVEVGTGHAVCRESPLTITLLQGLSRGSRMDTVIQKSTELGVTAIRPVITERTVVHLDAGRAAARVAHWRTIAVSACEQCGRSVLPEIHAPVPLADAIRDVSAAIPRLLLDPEGDLELMAVRERPSAVALAVGPEGGLSAGERNLLVGQGWQRLRLGPRIMRTETAPMAALSALQFAWGDMGNRPP